MTSTFGEWMSAPNFSGESGVRCHILYASSIVELLSPIVVHV